MALCPERNEISSSYVFRKWKNASPQRCSVSLERNTFIRRKLTLNEESCIKKNNANTQFTALSHRAHVTATTDLSSRVLTHRPLTPCRCSSVSGLSRCEEALSASDLGWNEGDSLPVANPGLMEQECWQKMPPPFGSPSDRKV